MTLKYIGHHLNARLRPVVTRAVNVLAQAVGRRLRNKQVSFALGQILVVAVK